MSARALRLLLTGSLLAFLVIVLPSATIAQNVATNPEVMPEYPGGMEAMMTYLGSQIHYPETARGKGMEGMTVVSFIVEKNGKVADVSVKKGFDKDCDAEAVRVVKAMPKWAPGKQAGKKVRTQYFLPIKFKLS